MAFRLLIVILKTLFVLSMEVEKLFVALQPVPLKSLGNNVPGAIYALDVTYIPYFVGMVTISESIRKNKIILFDSV